jgi:hypothetical protein
MSCPCKMCNGILDERAFHGFWGFDASNVEPEEEEQPKSLWERLSEVSDELNKYGAPAHFINELNDICDQLDSIDSDILKLQKKYDSIELGEISKKLY